MLSERENQALNGKAEPMHRTILNVARCMLFANVEYAAYVLNRSSCRANTKRRSPLGMLTGSVPSLSGIDTFRSPCTAYRDPGKKSWQPRAQVGMIVGKNDETKGLKDNLPKDRIVVTTQHTRNVGNLDGKQNSQLQTQLEREDPELKRAIEDREPATKWKETSTTAESAAPTKAKDGTKNPEPRKTRSRKKKSSCKRDKTTVEAELEGVNSDDEARLPAEELSTTHMRTRNMGAKHVPLGIFNAVVHEDPNYYHQAMKDTRPDKWA
ncbi:hypothetical protein P3T76_013238 [Phytophthora citrophthora]|uniref:Uncharacterized protein n=1 Tax=Phytophthora citrophthora TaxID=4793 RepID=A0AAD9G4T5_9STRA|nr:hypothetical protein P3T76_013238 [Phytophthora citrophthora]